MQLHPKKPGKGLGMHFSSRIHIPAHCLASPFSYSCGECHRRKQKVRFVNRAFVTQIQAPTYVPSVTDKFRAPTVFLGRFPSYAKLTAQESLIKIFTPVSLVLSVSSRLQFPSYGRSRIKIVVPSPLVWRMIPGYRRVMTT